MKWVNQFRTRQKNVLPVEPSGIQALKNSNPLKNVEGLAVLAVTELS